MAAYEIEVIPGLEDLVEDELRSRPFRGVQVVGRPREGRIAIRFDGSPGRLNALRSAVAIHQILNFPVPRPRGLLGHEHLTRLLDSIAQVIEQFPKGAIQTMHLSAAGADSTVFLRLAQEIATPFRLESVPGGAQLQIAIHPTGDRQGWQVSVRQSPTALSARAWRVCNLAGALNATIASAMVRLAKPEPMDRFLNVCCGSGTLLIERIELTPAKLALGVDLSQVALECARANVQASGHATEVVLTEADATQLELDSGSIDTVVVDLPFGHLVGPNVDLPTLYRGVVAEATRILAPGGRLVAITTRKKLLDAALESSHLHLRIDRTLELRVPFARGYIHPVVYAVAKTS